MTLNIQAALPAQNFALGEKVPLALAITNPGPGPANPVDPRNAGPYLRFLFQVPGGGRRLISMEAMRPANVPPSIARTQCPPEARRDFEFDLSIITELNQPGVWTVTVEYEPEPGQKWTSPTFTFTIQTPAGTFLDLVPDDSAFSAQRTLIWVEKDGGTGRILALPMEKQTYAPPLLRTAFEIGRCHADASPVASTSPANVAYPDRWIAWINRRRLLAFYWSREPGWRLPPVQIDLGFEPQLIRPLLASAPPDEGRPTCLAGMFWTSANGTGLAAYEMGEAGVGQLLPAVNLNGAVQAAWAVSPAAGNRGFIVALASGNRTNVVLVPCPAGYGLDRPRELFSIDGKLAAGDARVLPDGKIAVGAIVQNNDEWQRVHFTVAGPEPSVESIRPGAGTQALCARLDAAGDLHWAYSREKVVNYMAPGATESSWGSQRLAQYGSHFDISLRAEPPAVAIVYYDSEQGPTFVRI